MALAPWAFETKVFNAAGTQLTPGPQPTERLYTGQIWDWNANVYHYVARVYVPELARFTSTDPVREYANPYAYVKWAPTALIDPTGMFSGQIAPCLSAWDVLRSGFAELRERLQPGNGGYTGPHGAGWNGIRPGEFSQSAAAAGESSPSSLYQSGAAESVSPVETIIALLPTARVASASLRVAGAFARSMASSLKANVGKLYHYTWANPAKIAAEGLRPGASGKVFTTPAGNLSSLQAQVDLALPPNRGLPGHLIEIDVGTLQRMGISVPNASQVGRMFNMPGGGSEVVFPHAIPAEAIKVVR